MIHFTAVDKKKIADAVHKVELETSGEIVPYFVSKSDRYLEVSLFFSCFLGLFTSFVIGVMSFFWLLPKDFSVIETVVLIAVVMVLGFSVTEIFPGFKRILISQNKRTSQVLIKAKNAFLEEEVFHTKDRTGILLFISEFEHQALVLGDQGINEKVKPEEWKEVVDLMIKGIQQKKITEGIISAIEECKTLLLREDLHIKPNDTNELSNEIRIR